MLLRSTKIRDISARIKAFTSVCAQLEAGGHLSKQHVLNNKCSRTIQEFLIKQGIARHNVKANNHTINTAEQTVKSENYQVIYSVVVLNKHCLVELWIRMLPQMEATLNILCTLRHNSKLTVYEKMRINLT
jgi:hypothetical protein